MRNENHTTGEATGGRWARFWDNLRRVLGTLCV
jgi:hypothetical protein